MIASFIMATDPFRRTGARRVLALPFLGALWLLPAGDELLAIPSAPPAAPVPSTGAPHPSAPVVKVAGMTLEIRSGRIVVTEVAKGSPADHAGVLPLDVLLVA